MRIALCLFGLVGSGSTKSRNSKSDFRVLNIGYEHYFKHLLNRGDVDVFVHTWDTGFQNDVCKLYEPKDAIFETQIIFKIPSCIKFKFKNYNQIHSHFSRWYSSKASNDLKRKYEKIHEFKYDCVMSGRFDVAWETDLAFEKFDLDHFYAGYCCEFIDQSGGRYFIGGRGELYDMHSSDIGELEHIHIGYKYTPNDMLVLDHWFFSNSDYMDRFSTLYDCLYNYYVPMAELYGGSTLRVDSHRIVIHHLDKIGLLSKFRYAFHIYDDCPLIRRKYLGSKQ